MNSDIENKEELKISSHDDGSIEVWSGSCGEHIRRNEEFPCVHDALTYCINIESELATTNEALRVAKESGASIAAYNCTITKELETLKATGFNVQDVVDDICRAGRINYDHEKREVLSIYRDDLINQLDQASDKKDGEENE